MDSILLTVENGVGFITLNRPDKLNSFNREMALAFQSVLDGCAVNNEVRCVCITGAGKGFSAGQDLSEVIDPNGPGMERILSEHYNPIVKKIRHLEKPVVAAVNGVAAGAGANLALCCDIVVAASNASFIQAFSKIGLIPDTGGTYFLPRLIGFQKASALMMLGDKVSADEAEKMGMIYKVFLQEEFEEKSKALATTLASIPTKGLALIKQALNQSGKNNLDEKLVNEDELQQKAAATNDF
ncbi:MAG: 2-(1,2-epoxy,2-dihydrophenyl)acetyl-CoA isomerase, partial [Segetibacter sp.]|nr:2-(1,2-epoxy,2-dihydrophenyl)acetyl-CoA isomerase [Segetibacter sp.]